KCSKRSSKVDIVGTLQCGCRDLVRSKGSTMNRSPNVDSAEQIFREHAGRVFNLARRMLDNDADAEDVTQEVLVQVVRKLDTFRGEAALTTCLPRTPANAALALRRRRAARRERPLGITPERTLEDGVAPARGRRGRPGSDEQALGRELRQVIESAIQRLPQL